MFMELCGGKMSITKDQKILASDWNSYVRTREKVSILHKRIKDRFLDDDDSSGDGIFWVRSAGWNWSGFYELKTAGYSYPQNAEISLVEGGFIITVKNNQPGPTTQIPASANSHWDVIRYEFGFKTIIAGDQVVYGGGLFQSTTGSATAPVIPKFGDISNSDPNYTNLSAPNTHIVMEASGGHVFLTITLNKFGAGADIDVFDAEVVTSPSYIDDDIWLSPGKYDFDWEYDDTSSIGTRINKIYIDSQQFDDNVKQYNTIRTFNIDLSDLNALNAGLYGKITAGGAQSDPRLTDEDIEKKGGYENNYTGDW